MNQWGNFVCKVHINPLKLSWELSFQVMSKKKKKTEVEALWVLAGHADQFCFDTSKPL